MDLFTHYLLGAVIYTSVFGQMTADELHRGGVPFAALDIDPDLVRQAEALIGRIEQIEASAKA